MSVKLTLNILLTVHTVKLNSDTMKTASSHAVTECNQTIRSVAKWGEYNTPRLRFTFVLEPFYIVRRHRVLKVCFKKEN